MKLLHVSLWQHALRATRARRKAPACARYTATVPAPLPRQSDPHVTQGIAAADIAMADRTAVPARR
jgi:hypothetical protein